MFAGHLPKMHFDLTHWQAMPVYQPRFEGEFPQVDEQGFYRASLNGKPIVGCFPGPTSAHVGFAARPIIRVPMGRAV